MLQAFKLMRKKRIGGLPVMDRGSSTAIGNISLKDVQFLLTAPEIYHDYRFVNTFQLINKNFFIQHYHLSFLCSIHYILIIYSHTMTQIYYSKRLPDSH